jgi:hypothetical protein
MQHTKAECVLDGRGVAATLAPEFREGNFVGPTVSALHATFSYANQIVDNQEV